MMILTLTLISTLPECSESNHDANQNDAPASRSTQPNSFVARQPSYNESEPGPESDDDPDTNYDIHTVCSKRDCDSNHDANQNDAPASRSTEPNSFVARQPSYNESEPEPESDDDPGTDSDIHTACSKRDCDS